MKYFLLFFAVIMAISARSAQAQTDLIERGKTLFRAADCAACHLSDDGQTLSGGKAFSLPFGTVYAVNITPDRQTGIGAYTDEQWLRMMRTGVDRNGRHLYPVMPYTSYTFLNDADTLAIKTYLFTLKPVQAKTPENRLPFPFNQRWVMTFWNWFNNPNRRLAPVPDRTAEWNRGAYLVEALGHCDQCHTPRNFMFGLSRRAYAGTVQVGWRAYNLTSDTEHGLGGWSDDELFEYLSTGYAPHHGPASGPMAEAIENSLRYLPAEDIRAMIVYLRSIPARSDGPTRGKRPLDTPRENETVGQHIFQQACMGCHLEDGAGRQSAWGALEGAHSLSDPATTNITSVLRTGTSIETEHGKMAMPSFANAYTPQELAAVSEYLLSHFGGVKAQIKPRMFKN